MEFNILNLEPKLSLSPNRGQRLQEERNKLHLTQVEMAKSGGVSKGSQILYEKGKAPSADYLEEISKHGVDILYVLTGEREKDTIAAIVEQMKNVELEAFKKAIQATKDYWNDFTPIPRYDVQLAAGDGRLNDESQPVGHLAFNNKWLAQIGITPDKACLLSVQGDSMVPRLHDGDLVLIDQRRREIRNDRVYAFNDGDRGARIKRLELIPGQLVVIRSDNSDSNPPELRAGEAMNRLAEGIIGEVVWSCHSWGWTNTGHSLN